MAIDPTRVARYTEFLRIPIYQTGAVEWDQAIAAFADVVEAAFVSVIRVGFSTDSPATVTAGASGEAGSAASAARSDHVHPLSIPLATLGAAGLLSPSEKAILAGLTSAAAGDAAGLTTGTIDPARLPVLPGSNTITSSGAIADLDGGQQAQVKVGTTVLTTDGRVWRYSGSGSKTSEASYFNVADVTPDWSVIANKPNNLTAFAGLTGAADKLGYFTALGALALTDLTSQARTFLAAATQTLQRQALGATTIGEALFALTNPSAIRFLRINADNSASARTAAEMVGDLGAMPAFTRDVKRTTGTQANSTTTLADITQLTTGSLPVGAYEFRAIVPFQSAATTTGISLAINPASVGGAVLAANETLGVAHIRQAADNVNAFWQGDITAPDDRVTSASVIAISTTYVAYVTGTFRVTTAGAVALRFASEVGSSAVTLQAGGMLIVEAVG